MKASTITQILLFFLIIIILTTTPLTDEVLYWAVIPLLGLIILIVIIVSLIRILKNPKKRPVIHVILEKTKVDIRKQISKVKEELTLLEKMNKSKLLPEGYYNKIKEKLQTKLKLLIKQYKISL